MATAADAMIRTIVVGTDGSPQAQAAVTFTGQLAKQLGAEVILVHAMPPFPLGVKHSGRLAFVPQGFIDDARAAHERRARSEFCAPLAAARVAWQVHIQEGSAPEVIAEAVNSFQAQLIVVGRRGLRGLGELVLGSTSRALTHHASVPVLVVPPMSVHAG